MLEIFQYWQVNLVLAIISMVGFNQFYRITAKKAKDTASMFIIIFLIMSGIFALMMPFDKFRISMDWKIYGLLFVAIILYAINDRIKALAYKHLDISVISVLTQLSKVIMFLYGIFIFKEILILQNVIGAVLIFSGVLMVIFKKNIFQINKYVWLMILAAFTFATALSIDVKISTQFNLMLYLLIVFLFPAIIVFIVEKKNFSDLRQEFNLHSENKKYYFLTGFFFAMAGIFHLLALRTGPMSVVAPLTMIVVLINTIFGYIFLKERNDLIKRIVASILVVVGVFLLV